MGEAADKWEAKIDERAEEVCRALIRVGIMTHAQITRLLQINPVTAKRIIRYRWNLFDEQNKISKQAKRGRYDMPNRVSTLIKLTDETMEEYAAKEGIQRTRNHVRWEMQAQTLRIGNVLVSLRRAGVIYDEWDIMLPQSEGTGIHAQMVKYGDERDEIFRLGLHILPMKLNPVDETKKGMVFHGIVQTVISGVTQRAKSDDAKSLLLLAPRKYYATVLSALTHSAFEPHVYLLPLESFMEHPRWYLESIYTDEQEPRESLRQVLVNDNPQQKVPVGHEYTALAEIEEGVWRFLDTWTNGSVDRVHEWREDTQDYQVPGTTCVAISNVYVEDETMRTAVEAILGKNVKNKGVIVGGHKSIATVHPWPEEMITPEDLEEDRLGDPEKVVHSEDDLPDVEDWLNYFN